MMSTAKNRILRALSHTGFSARIAVMLAGAIAAACDVYGVSAPGTVVGITVTPTATLVAGTTQQMVAVGHDADGRVVPISPAWSVAAGGGTISSTGLFTAGTVPGVFGNTVVATVATVSARASITVIPGALATIVVTPHPVTLCVTATQRFTAVGKDAWGNIVPFTPAWSVITGGGTIDQNGMFTAGRTCGMYANTVQASSGDIKGLATVNVTEGPLATITVTPNPVTMVVGTRQQFVATGRDASGNTVQIAATWSIAAGGGTVDPAGLFTAGVTPGTFANTIKAASDTLFGTATIVVTAGPLATITVTPNPAVMTVNGVQQFTAVGTDAAGNVVPIAPTWDIVTTPNGASITQTGLFTAGTLAGTFTNTVRATVGGISGFATIVTSPGPLATITVTPNPVYLPTSGVQQFVAVGKDASGNVFPMAPVWSVVSGGGSIDPSIGVFRAGTAPGTFTNTVKATSGAISGAATVVVSAPPLQGSTTTFEDFNHGGIDQQHDWRSLGGLGAPPPANPLDTHCAVYDHEITDNTASGAYLYPAFGRMSLRISNAVTFGCYADQTFSGRTPNFAGQAGAWTHRKDGLVDYALPGGILQNHFEAEWSFASTVPDAQQPGLEVEASPARGDDTRMSWMKMVDLPDGLAVLFAEWTNPGSAGAFVVSTVAQGLDRRVPHTIKISMDFLDGPGNDIVRVFVDGALKQTGTSWENYYFYSANGHASFGGATPIVNRMMFRTGTDVGRGIPGTPAPATRGHGFVIDNLRQATFRVPVSAELLRSR